MCLTVLHLANGLGCSLIQFSSPGYYQQKKIKLMLEQYLKLDQRSESIHYHCIMLWSSLVLIIWADKFVASKKKMIFIIFILITKITDVCWWFLIINIDYFQKKPLLILLAHFFHHKFINSLLYTNKLSASANSWGQFQILERILNFSLFGKISKT